MSFIDALQKDINYSDTLVFKTLVSVFMAMKRTLLRLPLFRLADAEEENLTHLKSILLQVPREVNSYIITITPYYEIESASILYKIKLNFLKPVYLIF